MKFKYIIQIRHIFQISGAEFELICLQMDTKFALKSNDGLKISLQIFKIKFKIYFKYILCYGSYLIFKN